jgi:hypothetical protein
MNDFLFNLHSGVRWLVVLITLVALVKLILGLVQKQPYDTLTQRIMMAFSGIISLQWLIGIILFLVMNSFSVGYRWEHAVTMTIAVAVSHMHRRWKDAPDAIRYRNSLIIVIVVLVLVFIGVARLPQGWG